MPDSLSRDTGPEALLGHQAEGEWRRLRQPGSWVRAWDQLMLRLNERRERLRRTLPCGLILTAHPRIKPRIRDAAPDLWSIRSIVLEPLPGPLDTPAAWPGKDFENPRSRERLRPTGHEQITTPTRPPARADLVAEVREPEVEYGEDPQDPAPAAARLLRRAAGDLQAGDTRDAIDHAVRAIEILDSVQPPEGPDRAEAYALLAEAELADGDPASAESHLRRAVDLAEDPIERRTLEWLDALNDIAQGRGDLDRSQNLCQERLRRTRTRLEQEGDSLQALRDLSVSLDNLGDVLRDRGDLQQATDAFQESLQIDRKLLDTYGEVPQALRDLAIALFNLGRVSRSSEAPGEARELLTESANLERRRAELYGIRAGEPPGLVIILRELASLLDETGDKEAAHEVSQEIEILDQQRAEPNAPSDD